MYAFPAEQSAGRNFLTKKTFLYLSMLRYYVIDVYNTM
jgi:hypothetical protein